MQEIDPETWEREYESAFRAVFRNADPFDAPLSENVAKKGLLYPVAYTLDRSEFVALFNAATAVDDGAICVTVVEGRHALAEGPHWKVGPWDYEEYAELQDLAVLENAVYSPTGKWGLLLSHEQHAVVGGSATFLTALAKGFPGFEGAIDRFLAFWRENEVRHNADTTWVRGFLSHLFGPEHATAILLSKGRL